MIEVKFLNTPDQRIVGLLAQVDFAEGITRQQDRIGARSNLPLLHAFASLHSPIKALDDWTLEWLCGLELVGEHRA